MLIPDARRTCFACILLAAITAVAGAQDMPDESAPPDGPPSFGWGLGVAGLLQQQPYAGIDPSYLALPVLYFENRWVQLMGPRLDIKLPGIEWGKGQKLAFGVGTQLFGFNGYESDDAPILGGMSERKSGIFAGPFAVWSNPHFNLTAEWMLDASSNSEGQRLNLGLQRSWFVGGRFMLTPGVAVTWQDAKYSDYYYGVRSSEARADRPAYVVGSSLSADLSLRTDFMLDQHQIVFLALQGTLYGSGIQDSPLTGRSGEIQVLTGYLYRFQ